MARFFADRTAAIKPAFAARLVRNGSHHAPSVQYFRRAACLIVLATRRASFHARLFHSRPGTPAGPFFVSTPPISLIELSAVQHALDFRVRARHLPIGTN
ncbi:hypothetical protein [Sphingomonas sp.]|uniref:hypothetical protein n=1 Tax=Sphingomonas sp. TaxID=28214 RepID=UPI0035C7B248